MSNTPTESLKNKLLIAMPALDDSPFAKAVAYIFEDNENGSMGVVINKPMDMNFASVLEHLKIPVDNPELKKLPVLRGGPVAREHGFIVHRGDNIGQGQVTDPINHIIISASKQDLITFPQNNFDKIIITLGYAGWGKGQLWEEIMNNDWLVAPLDPKILFDVPFEQRWAASAALLGLDFTRLAPDAGHA